MKESIKTVIVGASGYTGAELVRLLYAHPYAEITALVADSNAGKAVGEIYPHLSVSGLPALVKLDEVDFSSVDVVFGCLPHGTSQEIISSLVAKYSHLKIIDLSADFRLRDIALYKEWYGEHQAPELQEDAVYGLSEIYREQIRQARLVACPGCYPTAALLPLIPLLKEGLVRKDSIIIDSKSGITGAGRSAKAGNLFAEVNENVKPYGLAGHRHVAEMEQELAVASGEDLRVIFTPQVVPVNRGILSTIYVEPAGDSKAGDLQEALSKQYKDEPFVHIIDSGHVPTMRDVYSTNHNHIAVFPGRNPKQAVIVSAIDNLTKGASGQAVQNMNLMFGFPEITGLESGAVFP